MATQIHWQDDFARTAAMLDMDLLMLHRFVLQLDGEDREQFDRLMNRSHRKLVKLVGIVNPAWLKDPDVIDVAGMVAAGDTEPVPDYESNCDPGDEQPT